jgi:exopolysaccharide biosynthesis protein
VAGSPEATVTNYRIEFDVQATTLGDAEQLAKLTLAQFVKPHEPTEFQVTYECRSTMTTTRSEVVMWEVNVIAVKGGAYGPIAT